MSTTSAALFLCGVNQEDSIGVKQLSLHWKRMGSFDENRSFMVISNATCLQILNAFLGKWKARAFDAVLQVTMMRQLA
jgi:hypothetical protein